MLLVLAAFLLAALAWFFIQLTGEVEIVYRQDPNPVEAHEANRKLKLLGDALKGNRKGFVRLSEVEINSFLLSEFQRTNQVPAAAQEELIKSGVLLHSSRLTFVNWVEKQFLGLRLLFVWQREVAPERTGDGWDFKVEGMQVGECELPGRLWPYVQRWFGGSDAIFEEKRAWLRKLPGVTITRNELSRTPELRLYTYSPEGKVAGTP